MFNKAKDLKNKTEKKTKKKASGGEYINIYENDPNYQENLRRIKEIDGPFTGDLLPVPTPGYVYIENRNVWIPEGTNPDDPTQTFNKPVAKGEESGMTQESEGIGYNRPENIVQDFTFDPSPSYTFTPLPEDTPDISDIPEEDDGKKKTKKRKYRYPKSKVKPHYLRNGKFFRSNKTMRRHKRNPLGR